MSESFTLVPLHPAGELLLPVGLGLWPPLTGALTPSHIKASIAPAVRGSGAVLDLVRITQSLLGRFELFAQDAVRLLRPCEGFSQDLQLGFHKIGSRQRRSISSRTPLMSRRPRSTSPDRI